MFHQASDHGGQVEFNPAGGLAYPPRGGGAGLFPSNSTSHLAEGCWGWGRGFALQTGAAGPAVYSSEQVLVPLNALRTLEGRPAGIGQSCDLSSSGHSFHTRPGLGPLCAFCHPLRLECQDRAGRNFCLLCSRCTPCLACACSYIAGTQQITAR